MSSRRRRWPRSCASGASSRCCSPIVAASSFGDELPVRRIRGGAIAGQTRMAAGCKSVAELAAGCVQAAWAPAPGLAARGRRLRRLCLGTDRARRRRHGATDDHPRAECGARSRQQIARQARRADRDRFRNRFRLATRGRAQGGANRHAGARRPSPGCAIAAYQPPEAVGPIRAARSWRQPGGASIRRGRCRRRSTA